MSKWRKSLGALAAAGFIAALAAAPTSAHAWWDNWGNWRPPAQHFYGGYGYGHHGEHEYGHPHHGHGGYVYHRDGHWDRHGDHYDWHDTSHYDYLPHRGHPGWGAPTGGWGGGWGW